MNFFKICLDELGEAMSEQIRYNALAHKMSNLEGHDFEKMMQDNDQPTGKKREPIVVDHEAQMKQAKG